MYVKTAHARLHAATMMIRQDADMATVTPPSFACSACGRPWSEVEDPNQAAIYQYSSAQAKEYVCTACYTVRIPARHALGVERYSQGNPDNPVFAKLGMLPGSGGVLTAHNQLHLALPQGFIDKFKDGEIAAQGRLHRASSFDLLLSLLAEDGLGDMADGIVFVETWGRKADVLVANLTLTRSLSELWCCSESGAYCLDLESMIDSARWLVEQGWGDKADKPAFWKPIKDAAAGRRDDVALGKWAEKLGPDHAQDLLNRLPLDPYARTQLPRLMKLILPWVKGGDL